jgi:hypothetical protein
VQNRCGSILKTTTGVLLVLVPLALEVVGCHGGAKPAQWSELGSDSKPKKKQSKEGKEGLSIVAKSSRETVRLTPDDLVRIMQRVGFSDDQIMDLGTDLFNALLLSGGADVYYGQRLEMMFAVNNRQVQIQSRTRGTFIYDTVAQRFVLGATPVEKGR